MKTNYEGFRGWINYIRDYKDNIDNDLISANEVIKANEEIKKLKKKIADNVYIAKEKDGLIAKLNQRIDYLNEKISSHAQRCEELRKNLNTTMKENEHLNEKLKEKEKARRKNAGAIGGLKAKINELTNQLDKANYTIDFYRKSKKPNIEEIKAYDTRMKEVEKRLKQNAK